jgi:hypothetical protein
MKRYLKAVLGGFLAVLAAFGWLSAIGVILAWRGVDIIVTSFTPAWVSLLLFVGLIFSAGFFLAFRAAYSKISN